MFESGNLETVSHFIRPVHKRVRSGPESSFVATESSKKAVLAVPVFPSSFRIPQSYVP